MVTVAPATTAPEGSVIVPRMVEAPNCPQRAVLDTNRMITRTGKLHLIVDRFINDSFRAASARNLRPTFAARRRGREPRTNNPWDHTAMIRFPGQPFSHLRKPRGETAFGQKSFFN